MMAESDRLVDRQDYSNLADFGWNYTNYSLLFSILASLDCWWILRRGVCGLANDAALCRW